MKTYTHWWVSTPHWTIYVMVGGDHIASIAPILRRAWQDQSWMTFRAWVVRRYAGQARFHQFTCTTEKGVT